MNKFKGVLVFSFTRRTESRYRPLSVGGNAVELEDRTMGCSLHDNRLHFSVAIFFCPVLQFRGFDVTSERGL